ncbi:MAG: SDR family NAD(P)-dependent oxidoreductase [Alphaproteobacteria bacterium]|nr:SDR family NAD(P)-dependent oxidoreductase [Alphaproteobacteria bacterium]
MRSLPDNFNALVVGSSGGIGAALTAELNAVASCGHVAGLSRSGPDPLELTDETTMVAAADRLRAAHGTIHLIICATGILSSGGAGPEKAVSDLDPERMAAVLAVNTIGPALLYKHFVPLLPASGKCVFAVLSARVGSISDNRLGGWYSYRASKAALNQIVRSVSVEVARKRPEAVCLALHPGTIETDLTRPFARGRYTHTATRSARNLLTVMDNMSASETGQFFAYDGSAIGW